MTKNRDSDRLLEVAVCDVELWEDLVGTVFVISKEKWDTRSGRAPDGLRR